ncbi:LysM peptidoglycan-binding domain-containing M23 family metallopeptidase [Treponema maltophilum]|uniref:LysM peptidoglycan-binding domain-containing M23 family metallopeptidase n=1 Tax=Treponema maltophilum TaxID=51160 RepID=UPI001B7F999C|nr:LysM peptidoglycan-binding domain-containing M23 family metallopeptidase [Treponema maltophilum]
MEKGDTLYSLSKKYGVSVDDLRSANAISGSDLYAGQKLIIPAKKNDKRVTYESYTVKAGDTLYSIAKRSEITVDELRRLNSLDSSAVLKIGQNLKVPAQSGATAQSGSAAQNAGSSSSGLALSVPDTSSSARDNLSLIGSDKDPRAYSKKNGDTSLVWPVKASEVVYVAGKISGVALTGAKNEHVTAIRSGTVMFSGIYRGFGQVVFVQSANGLIYVYTGLDTLAVTKGQKVNYGQQLGIIGSDPISGKSLINLMVFKNGSPMDPAKAPRG